MPTPYESLSPRAKRKPRYKTLFMFDRTLPRELYYSIQRRLNMMGYGAVWAPRSAMRGKKRPEELIDYCLARGILVLATFDRRVQLPPEARGKLVLIKLRGGRWKSVNKILAELFKAARELKGVPASDKLDC